MGEGSKKELDNLVKTWYNGTMKNQGTNMTDEIDTLSVFTLEQDGDTVVAVKGRGRLRGLRCFTPNEARLLARQLNRIAASASDNNPIQ